MATCKERIESAYAEPEAAAATGSVDRSTSQVEQRPKGVSPLDGERVVFVEESNPSQYLKLVASGDLDELLLEALKNYIKRQKRRLTKLKPSVPGIPRAEKTDAAS